MKIKSILETKKFTLEVTMPQALEFVDAVLKGGAGALKMRCNTGGVESVLHNGIKIGSFQDRKAFLKDVVDRAGEVPVGLVACSAAEFITEDELTEMEEIGIDYFNLEPDYVPCYMFESKKLSSVLTVMRENTSPDLLKGLDSDPRVDAVEANVVPDAERGTRFVYADVLRYRAITETLHQPIIATGQRAVKPSDVKYFYEAGCKAFMLGVVAFRAAQEANGGGAVTPETCLRVTSEFREAIEKL